MQVANYLFFNGQCREAFEFYQTRLGGEITSLLGHQDMPPGAESPDEWRDKILHASLRIGDTTLMASDLPGDEYQQPQGFAVSLSVDTASEAERVFNALAENGTVQSPLEPTFFAARFGTLVDRFGIPWMIVGEQTQ